MDTALQELYGNLLKYWIAFADIDGYRVSAAAHITADFSSYLATTLRFYAAALGKENFFAVGEVQQSTSPFGFMHVGKVQPPQGPTYLPKRVQGVMDEILSLLQCTLFPDAWIFIHIPCSRVLLSERDCSRVVQTHGFVWTRRLASICHEIAWHSTNSGRHQFDDDCSWIQGYAQVIITAGKSPCWGCVAIASWLWPGVSPGMVFQRSTTVLRWVWMECASVTERSGKEGGRYGGRWNEGWSCRNHSGRLWLHHLGHLHEFRILASGHVFQRSFPFRICRAQYPTTGGGGLGSSCACREVWILPKWSSDVPYPHTDLIFDFQISARRT